MSRFGIAMFVTPLLLFGSVCAAEELPAPSAFFGWADAVEETAVPSASPTDDTLGLVLDTPALGETPAGDSAGTVLETPAPRAAKIGTSAATPETTPLPPATLPPPSPAMPVPTPVPVIERPYRVGDSGDDVHQFKLRLQLLGYFDPDVTLSDKVSEKTLERVNELLVNNGLEPVEIITTEIQTLVFSREDLAIIPTPTPPPTPKPLIAPVGAPSLPVLDTEGFLPDADGEFVFQDDADGLWYYISHDLYVNIRRYNDLEEENVWFETEIKTRGGERLLSFHEDSIRVYQQPVAIARANRAVLAFTDDFFATRAVRRGDPRRKNLSRPRP